MPVIHWLQHVMCRHIHHAPRHNISTQFRKHWMMKFGIFTTYIICGGKFINIFVGNFNLFIVGKKFCISVLTRFSYQQTSKGLFYLNSIVLFIVTVIQQLVAVQTIWKNSSHKKKQMLLWTLLDLWPASSSFRSLMFNSNFAFCTVSSWLSPAIDSFSSSSACIWALRSRNTFVFSWTYHTFTAIIIKLWN